MENDVDALFAKFCRTGDPRALGDVYDELAPELFRIALHTVGEAALAEDVLQATFLAAIERRASFDVSQRAMPWLVGILANEARRARARAPRAADPARGERALDEATDADSAGSDAERAELVERLDAALAKLPDAFRAVLVLRLKHGLNAGEIAEALGRAPGTVRSQLQRGIESLRRHLPASLAGAWLASLAQPTRGLGAVREVVLAHALALETSVAASAALTGVIAMKKMLLALAAAAVLATVWIAWRTSEPALLDQPVEATVALAVPPAPQVSEPTAVEREAVARPDRTAPEQAVSSVASAPTKPRGAALLVRALSSDASAPAAGEIVLVTLPNQRNDESRVATTDAEGIARFDGLPAGSTFVRLLRGGGLSTVVGTRGVVEVELQLRPGVTVEGSVSDEQGRPLAGAELWVSERYRLNIGHVLARTDARGRFSLRDIAPEQYVAARHRGYATSVLGSVRGQPGDTLQIPFVLARSGVGVRGRVRDELGQPVASASVLLGAEQPAHRRLDDGSLGFGPPPARARTDQHGEFQLESAPPGLQDVQARAPGFAPFASEFDTSNAAGMPLEIVLVRSARIEGRVLDGQGRPVARAQIRAGELERFATSSTWSQFDGRFVLDDAPVGEVRVTAEQREHGRDEALLALSPAGVHVWEPQLRIALSIHGRVLDAERRPLANWIVLAVAGADLTRSAHSQPTTAEGAFAIDGIDDKLHALHVQRPDGWREFPVLIVPDVWPSPQALELIVDAAANPSARIVGRVLDPDGRPVAGTELHVWHEDLKLWRSSVSDGQTGRMEQTVPAGALTLELRHADFPWTYLGRRELAAGATLDFGEVLFERPARLSGRVRGLDPELRASLRLMLAGSNNRESGVVHVAEDGGLSSGPIAPGKHTLVLRADGARQVRVELELRAGDEHRLELTLERCATRQVIFEVPPAQTRPAWLAASLHGSGASSAAWADSISGDMPLEMLVSAPAGTYRLMARGELGWSADVELELGESSTPLSVLLSKP